MRPSFVSDAQILKTLILSVFVALEISRYSIWLILIYSIVLSKLLEPVFAGFGNASERTLLT